VLVAFLFGYRARTTLGRWPSHGVS
jgi:hypothetical protein